MEIKDVQVPPANVWQSVPTAAGRVVMVPGRFTVTCADADFEVTIEVGHLESKLVTSTREVPFDFTPGIDRVTIERTPSGGRTITKSALAKLPLSEVVAEAAHREARYYAPRVSDDDLEITTGPRRPPLPSRYPVLKSARYDTTDVVDEFLRPPQRPRPRGSTDEELQEVADIYRAAVERRDHNPTQQVKEAKFYSSATAKRRVREARDKGYLGEAIGTKPGESTDSREGDR